MLHTEAIKEQFICRAHDCSPEFQFNYNPSIEENDRKIRGYSTLPYFPDRTCFSRTIKFNSKNYAHPGEASILEIQPENRRPWLARTKKFNPQNYAHPGEAPIPRKIASRIK